MLKSLWIRFFVLLIVVAVVALSAAFLLRELIIKDFRVYLEGEMEDRLYWVMADIEVTYERYSGWKEDIMIEDAIWALMLGLDIKIRDTEGKLIMDTDTAISKLSPLMKKRISSISGSRLSNTDGSYSPYPLFLGGREIGRLEVKFLRPRKEHVFIERSNRFLLISLIVLGGLATFLSIVVSKMLTDPIKKLADAAQAISEGNLKSRVTAIGSSEIKRLADTFNKMAKTLELQEALRKKLTSNVAHELRTPLSAIRGMLEGIMDDVLSMDKEQIKALYAETGRLQKILEGIEELSQAQASPLTLKKQALELNPFLKHIIERFSKLFLDKGVSLQFECDKKLIINADPDKLSQVVINLLSNALKVTEKNGSVRVGAGRRGLNVFIRVSDTGSGIKQEDLPFIFERFYKATEGGLGIGLAIVKELIDAHDGRIEVQNEYGKGSTFTIYIPGKQSSQFSTIPSKSIQNLLIS